MNSFIQLNKLFYFYPDVQGHKKQALADINLKIAPGEFVVIIGSNGSGKSTLARQLNGLLIPSQGECLVSGLNTKDPGKLKEIRQLVGMVFQNPDNQIVTAVVEEDIAFGPENLGLPSAEICRRVDNALRLVDMEEYRYHSPHLLSGGQKQRIAIAGVLAMEPKCMVFDEATAMLDPYGRKEVIDIVERLNKQQGITIILITHHMAEAVNADRVIVMQGGKVIEDDKPERLFLQTEKLSELGLSVPLAAQIACSLRKRGIGIPENIITDTELVEAICQYY